MEQDLDQAKEYLRTQAGQLIHIRKENSSLASQRDQAMQTLTAMRKKVQEKVPVISLVEERRLELESQNRKAKEDVRSSQEQLRE